MERSSIDVNVFCLLGPDGIFDELFLARIYKFFSAINNQVNLIRFAANATILKSSKP